MTLSTLSTTCSLQLFFKQLVLWVYCVVGRRSCRETGPCGVYLGFESRNFNLSSAVFYRIVRKIIIKFQMLKLHEKRETFLL